MNTYTSAPLTEIQMLAVIKIVFCFKNVCEYTFLGAGASAERCC